MSDSREVEEEDTWSREEDELIPRYDLDDSDEQIPCRQQQKPGVSADRRKEKNKKDNDTKGVSHGNRRKMQAKAKQLLISPVRRFEKRLIKGFENRAAESTSRRSTAPFPYDGEDFGGSSSRYLCFLRSSNTPPSASPMMHNGAAASSETPGAVNIVKPKNSSYYYFLKSLIENNDFYTPECNVHRDITSSQSK